MNSKSPKTTVSTARRWEPLTPLTERIRVEAPALLPGLQQLQQKMTPADFAEYILPLAGLRQNNSLLLVITRKEMHRSIIERNFLTIIKESFAAANVRIISQP